MDKDELKKKLLANETAVLQEDGTELPYTGKYLNETAKGIYNCKVCGAKLFSSEKKLDSKTGPSTLQGWPSFDEAIPGAVTYKDDGTFGLSRTEAGRQTRLTWPSPSAFHAAAAGRPRRRRFARADEQVEHVLHG